MDGVNLKPGWLSDGRSRANNYGGNNYGDYGYRQGDLLSGFGGSGDSGAGAGQNRQGVARGGAAPRNASLPVAPRPGGPVVARPVVPGAPQPRPGPAPVAPPPSSSASSASSSASWANQSRTGAGAAPAVQPTPVKLAPPATLNYGKPTPSRPAAPAAGRGGVTPSAPAAPKVPVLPGVVGGVPPPGAATANKEQQREKLEERKRFLEQLSKGGGAEGEALSVPAPSPVLPDRNKGDGLLGPGPGSQYKRPQMPDVVRVQQHNGKIEEPRIQQIQVSREEWDAKWQKLYGSFAADGLSNGLSNLGVDGDDEYLENQDGESLLTEEELASFKARHGSGIPQRRPKQLILNNGFCLTPTAAEDDAVSSSDSDEE